MSLKLPSLINGTVVPRSVQEKIDQEERENERLKQQFRHDWKVEIFSVLGGSVAGLITSLIFWLITSRV